MHRARPHNVSAPVHPINIARTLHGYGQFISSPLDEASLCCVLPWPNTAWHRVHQVETSTRPTAVFRLSCRMNDIDNTGVPRCTRSLVAMFVVKDGTQAISAFVTCLEQHWPQSTSSMCPAGQR
jgi:hypothetical protein